MECASAPHLGGVGGVGSPCLGAPAAAQTTNDYDDDNDNLIDVRNLAQLNAIRWDLDGNGTVAAGNATNYAAAFPSPATGMGCSSTCAGYELRTDLDFDTDNDGDVDSSDTYTSWTAIGGTFSSTFEGNGNTITRLTANQSNGNVALFNIVSGTVRNLGLIEVNLRSTGSNTLHRVAALTANLNGSSAEVRGVWATGTVTATNRVRPSGLVGELRSGARLVASYFNGDVASTSSSSNLVGGLALSNDQSTIIASYFTGSITAGGNSIVGGLVRYFRCPATITASYVAATFHGSTNRHGIVYERDTDNGTCTNTANYFDSDVAGFTSAGDGGSAQTTSALKNPTSATGIFANWDDLDVSGDGTADEDPWSFQTNQYPVLTWGDHAANTQLDTAPTYGAATVPDKTYTMNAAIAAFEIPQPTGGNGAYDYTVTGLPAGLIFDEDGSGTCTAARTVCGTPTATAGNYTVTVTVNDGDVNTASSDQATLTFTITVELPRVLATPASLALTEGSGSATFTVRLSHAPTAAVTVTVTSDTSEVTVDTSTAGGLQSTLAFSTTNWATAQTVTVAATADGDTVDERATITSAASGHTSAIVHAAVDDAQATGTDYDGDNDSLIDIDSLAKLNAVRWDLDGDGTASAGNTANYAAAFGSPEGGMGCPGACTGYELTADLDFDTDNDGDVDSNDTYPSWVPISGGYYSATFEGNGNTISNLTITNHSSGGAGLFDQVSGTIRNVGLEDVNVTATGTNSNWSVGALAAHVNGSNAAVLGSWATGSVTSTERVRAAGLVGEIRGGSRLAASYFNGTVSAPHNNHGHSAGLVFIVHKSSVVASYFNGSVTAGVRMGGLIHNLTCPATVASTYAAATFHGSTNRAGAILERETADGNCNYTANYFDSDVAGSTIAGAGVSAQTTSALETPTSATGIFADWDNLDVDGDGTADEDPWNFRTRYHYPALSYGGVDPADQGNDYDDDGDGLIEISTLAQLNAVRWDLDGNGAPASGNEASYFSAFRNGVFESANLGLRCPTNNNDADDNDCLGYELLNDLDFDTDGDDSTHTNGVSDSGDAYHNSGDGWGPSDRVPARHRGRTPTSAPCSTATAASSTTCT